MAAVVMLPLVVVAKPLLAVVAKLLNPAVDAKLLNPAVDAKLLNPAVVAKLNPAVVAKHPF